MTRATLIENIRSKQNYLCVGLDTDPEKIPHSLRASADPVFEFNKRIIKTKIDHCVAYKLNTAYYEVSGATG